MGRKKCEVEGNLATFLAGSQKIHSEVDPSRNIVYHLNFSLKKNKKDQKQLCKKNRNKEGTKIRKYK